MTPQQLTGAAIPITISGKKYQGSILSDKDYAELDSAIQDEVFEIAYRFSRRLTSQDERSEMLQAAAKAAATSGWGTQECWKYLNSPKGQARLMWQMIKKHHPKLTWEAFFADFTRDEHIQDNLTEASIKFNAVNSDVSVAPGEDKEPADATSKSEPQGQFNREQVAVV